jgi:di/tricarboxylate transporter
MTPEQYTVLFILVGALVLFFSERLRFDVVAVLVVVSLLGAKVLGLEVLEHREDALSGFASSVLPILACLFVLTRALQRNGFAELASSQIQKVARGNELVLFIVLLVVVGVLSAIINNTAVTAMAIPIVLRCYDRIGRSPRAVYLPLAYISLIGGTMTLIGTTTNLVVHQEILRAAKQGLGSFTGIGMFEMSKLGALLTIIGIGALLVLSRWLLKSEKRESLFRKYNVREFLSEILVKSDSDVVGRPLQDLHFGQDYDITVVGIVRDGRTMFSPPPTLQVREEDVFMVQGGVDSIVNLRKEQRLELVNEIKVEEGNLRSVDLNMAEIVILPNSNFIDQTIRALDLRDAYGVTILALSRQGLQYVTNMADIPLHMGDTLLIQGHPAGIERLRRHPNLLVLETLEHRLTHRRLPLVLGVILLMVFSNAVLNWVFQGGAEFDFPLELSCLLAVLTLLATRCISLRDVYESIDWRLIVLIGGLLPLGLALQHTGTVEDLLSWAKVGSLQGFLGIDPNFLVLGVVLVLTMFLTQIITNVAAAALLTPVAIEVSAQLGVDYRPFVMAVAFAASFAFLTPMGHQVNILVMGPGNYRPRDFLKLGSCLAFIMLLVTWIALPWFFPFHPS